MKKIFVFILLAFAFSACSKKDTFNPAEQAQKDDQLIQDYLKANQLAATKDSSGLYYLIESQGYGDHPDINSQVTVKYTGTFLNGQIFDQSKDSVSFALSNVIPGWQIGLPKIKAGGKIKLFVPSALAYGNHTFGTIPANSVLIFDIDLLDVN